MVGGRFSLHISSWRARLRVHLQPPLRNLLCSVALLPGLSALLHIDGMICLFILVAGGATGRREESGLLCRH